MAFMGSTIVSATALTLVQMVGHGNEALGFRVVMGIFGIVGCFCFFLTFALVREKNLQENKKQATLKETVKSLAQNTPWKLFALNILFMWTVVFHAVLSTCLLLQILCRQHFNGLLVATIMTMVPMAANLTVPFLAKRLGKRNLYCTAAAVQLLGLLIIWLGNLQTNIILVGAFISACGYGIKESIYFSMQADPWIMANGRPAYRQQEPFLL